MYKIIIIKFLHWADYELQVNNFFNEGWQIDETVKTEVYERNLGYKHIIRFIKRKDKR